MFKLSDENRKVLLKYLSSRHYAEVFQLVAMLVGLKPDTNSKDKEDWKEAKGLDKIPKPIKKEN